MQKRRSPQSLPNKTWPCGFLRQPANRTTQISIFVFLARRQLFSLPRQVRRPRSLICVPRLHRGCVCFLHPSHLSHLSHTLRHREGPPGARLQAPPRRQPQLAVELPGALGEGGGAAVPAEGGQRQDAAVKEPRDGHSWTGGKISRAEIRLNQR